MEKLNDPEYRKNFESVAKKLGEKYGPMLNSVLAEIREKKNFSRTNQKVNEVSK